MGTNTVWSFCCGKISWGHEIPKDGNCGTKVPKDGQGQPLRETKNSLKVSLLIFQKLKQIKGSLQKAKAELLFV